MIRLALNSLSVIVASVGVAVSAEPLCRRSDAFNDDPGDSGDPLENFRGEDEILFFPAFMGTW